jgi:hypothetical protein
MWKAIASVHMIHRNSLAVRQSNPSLDLEARLQGQVSKLEQGSVLLRSEGAQSGDSDICRKWAIGVQRGARAWMVP